MKKNLKYLKTFEYFQSVAVSSLYDTGAAGAFGRFKNANPALELEEISKEIKITPVSPEVYDLFKWRRYSEIDNKRHMCEFIGKDNNLYVVQKDFDRDKFEVYNVEDVIKTGYKIPIGVAYFNVQNDYFSGYEHNNSIEINPEYRRKGIATAITDFAELYYKKPYKPSKLLSAEMQGFVDNRFKKREN